MCIQRTLLLKKITILYVRSTQFFKNIQNSTQFTYPFFKECIKLCALNEHYFSKKLHKYLCLKHAIFQIMYPILHFQPTKFFEECTLYHIFNVHKYFNKCPETCRFNVHNFSKNVLNFAHSTNTISERIYIFMYVQSMKLLKERLKNFHVHVTQFFFKKLKILGIQCTLLLKKFT